jgi:hypothetical protein
LEITRGNSVFSSLEGRGGEETLAIEGCFGGDLLPCRRHAHATERDEGEKKLLAFGYE